MDVGLIRSRLSDIASRAGLRPSRGVTVGLAIALLALGSVVLWRVWSPTGQTSQDVVFETQAESESSEGQHAEPSLAEPDVSQEATDTVATAFVHVVGAVRRPGVYELPVGSRVEGAVEAAGGLLSSAAPEGLNLARELADGEQVLVPTKEQFEAGEVLLDVGGAAASPSGHNNGMPLDLNSADAAALETLPGIGPATAAKIVADREANGPFASPQALMRVSGIGPAKLEALEGLVTTR